jgi:hypothetical protein
MNGRRAARGNATHGLSDAKAPGFAVALPASIGAARSGRKRRGLEQGPCEG